MSPQTQSSLTALETLQQVFGFPEFRGHQEEIISHVLASGDALVLMPTGGGKSLCYQIPALLRPGVAIVVSPLISLMQDQVAALRENGVRAAVLNSTLTGAEALEVERQMRSGDLDLVYVAPERLLTPRFLELLDTLAAGARVALFAIDEAHCVSQWGHDFRPEYIQLSLLHERYPAVPRLALTATADPQTRTEIIERLQLQAARIFISSFDRPNIRYRIIDKDRAHEQLLAFIRQEHAGDAGIVYRLSRRKVEETADWLCEHGFNALPYHAGMDAETRRRHQERFQQEDGIIICATIAFGMGIDKPDVRFVAHLDLPKSIEGYYQETGRAGRDSEAANAWMVYGLADAVLQRRMIDESDAGEAYKRLSHARLDALLGLCESATCRRQRLLAYFGESATPCGNCDLCLDPPETWDGTQAAQKALSAVFRCGQRFGSRHLIDILLGRDTERIRSWNHHSLSVYGIGQELDEGTWRTLFRQLVTQGMLAVDHEQHGALRLTEAARPVLKGTQSLILRRHRPSGKKKATIRPQKEMALSPVEGLLFQQLREWRARMALQHAVPAYVILHDKTLMQIAQLLPGTAEVLLDVAGISMRKCESYGEDLLNLCREHAEAQGLALHCAAKPPARRKEAAPIIDPSLSDTANISLAMALRGLKPEEVARQREMKASTIHAHLAQAIALGSLSLDDVLVLETAEREMIENTLLAHADELRLKPVWEALEGRYSYDQLRCLAATVPEWKEFTIGSE